MYDATKLPWVPLSPNMPTFTTALLYHSPASRNHRLQLLTPQFCCNTVNAVQLPRSWPAGGHIHERRQGHMHSIPERWWDVYSLSVLLSLESDYFEQVLRG